jgi:hypothetical protein
MALALDADPGALTKPITPSLGLEGEAVAVFGPPSPKADWQKPITQYI